MKKSVIFIILIIIAILIGFPLIIRLYITYVPGETVGTIDGWLGFLGGVTGGLMAFFSAYWVFSHDQKQRNKTWLYTQSEHTTKARLLEVKSCLIFESGSGKTNFDTANRMFVNKVDYPVAIIKFSNVSNNFAKNISIAISRNLNTDLFPRIHHEGHSELIESRYFGDLPIQTSSCFTFHISPELISENNTVEFVVKSHNLQNEISKQKVTLKINRRTKAWDFVN